MAQRVRVLLYDIGWPRSTFLHGHLEPNDIWYRYGCLDPPGSRYICIRHSEYVCIYADACAHREPTELGSNIPAPPLPYCRSHTSLTQPSPARRQPFHSPRGCRHRGYRRRLFSQLMKRKGPCRSGTTTCNQKGRLSMYLASPFLHLVYTSVPSKPCLRVLHGGVKLRGHRMLGPSSRSRGSWAVVAMFRASG